MSLSLVSSGDIDAVVVGTSTGIGGVSGVLSVVVAEISAAGKGTAGVIVEDTSAVWGDAVVE